ncbi:MAG: 50S ribosomal protein L10 [Dehalococcoidales bacterium]|nr:50S ribosomal protein L10 [Dehalococcoidales bacterium]
MPTTKKVDTVKEIADELANSQLAVLADYRGLTVAEIGQLRRQLREGETQLMVAKNTLIKRAAAQSGVESSVEQFLAGPTAVAFVHSRDIAKSAKALSTYARASKVFAIKGGILGKRVLAADLVQQLADLPPREVLLARVVGGMQAPISGLVTVLGGTVRGLMYVLQARKDQLTAEQGG